MSTDDLEQRGLINPFRRSITLKTDLVIYLDKDFEPEDAELVMPDGTLVPLTQEQLSSEIICGGALMAHEYLEQLERLKNAS